MSSQPPEFSREGKPRAAVNPAFTSPAEASQASGAGRAKLGDAARWLWEAVGPLLGLLAVLLIFGVLDQVKPGPDTFLTSSNLRTLVLQSSIVIIGALGMTLIIVSGGIDLSVGSCIALCSVVLAYCLQQGYPAPFAVQACVLCGMVLGALNGLCISLLRIPPFIATLGSMTVFLGFAKILAKETTIRPLPSQIPEWLKRLMFPAKSWEVPGKENFWVTSGDLLLNHPAGVWLALGFAVATAILLRYFVFGRHVFALGSNEATARLCGINVGLTRVLIYTLAGLLAGVAGILQFARLQAGSPKDGVGMELKIIAAVVIGGASLNGGRGSVLGTLVGAGIMKVIEGGCTQLGLSNSLQDIVIGSIIIAAVTLDQWRARK